MNFITSLFIFKGMGLLGCLFAIVGSVVAAGPYLGRQGQRYSPLNHYISELGEIGVSKRAWAFNWGLGVGGLLLLPTLIHLGLRFESALGYVGIFFGVIMAVSLSLVGVFSMERIKPHVIAAYTFFHSGLIMILVFSLAFFFQPEDSQVFSKWIGLAGIPAIAAFIWFLRLNGRASQAGSDLLVPDEGERPRVSVVTVAEWAIFAAVVFWLLVVTVFS